VVNQKRFSWELAYLGILALLSIYAAAAGDLGIASFTAMPIFTYVSISVIALGLLVLVYFLNGIAQSINKRSPVTALFGLVLSGFVFVIFLISVALVASMYWGFDEPTRTNLLSPIGAIVFIVSLYQVAKNPRSSVNLFTGGSMWNKYADRLISASLSGFIVLFIFSFLALHISDIEGVDFFRLFASLFIGSSIASRIRTSKGKDDMIFGFIAIVCIGLVYIASLLLSVFLQPFVSAFPSLLLPLFLAITYAAFILMRIKKYPHWYFGASKKKQADFEEQISTDEIFEQIRKK